MTTLIVPAAGRSTRYGLSRPKFLLQHPSGKTMLAAGLDGLRGQGLTGVVVVTLREYVESTNIERITQECSETVGCNVRVVTLSSPTASMVDTLVKGIQSLEHDGPIVVKDTDNFISAGLQDRIGSNFIVYGDLRQHHSTVAGNKSYVALDSHGNVTGITEKSVTSNYFNTGLIGFSRASEFLAMAETLSGGESYVSDIVHGLIVDGQVFSGVAASAYEDWGTIKEWREYCRSWATLFVDLDGVTVRNEDPNGLGGGWSRFEPIEENIQVLLNIQRAGRSKFVFTTSRSEAFRESVQAELASAGFIDFDLVMGLPHAQRFIINDFAPTNPYPSATAVNLPRNEGSLATLLPIADLLKR